MNGSRFLATAMMVVVSVANAHTAYAQQDAGVATATAYSFQFGLDPQHTGRSAFRGPRNTPAIRWRVRTQQRVFSSPALSRNSNIVFAGIDGVVHMVDQTGIERAAFVAPHRTFSSPAVWNDLVIVGHDGEADHRRGAVVALDRRGNTRWSVQTAEDADSPITVGNDGMVYVSTSELISINPSTGQVRWTTPLTSHAFGAPALTPNGQLVIATDLNGEISVVRASDGHLERRIHVGETIYGGALVVDDNTIVVGTADERPRSTGHVRSYTIEGTSRWDFTPQSDVRPTPALTRDGVVIVGSDDGGIYGIRVADGTQAWRVPTSGRVRASARIDADGFVYIGSEDDVLYAINPQGAVAWTFTLGADIDSSVLLLPNGSIAVGCDDAGLYVLDAR